MVLGLAGQISRPVLEPLQVLFLALISSGASLALSDWRRGVKTPNDIGCWSVRRLSLHCSTNDTPLLFLVVFPQDDPLELFACRTITYIIDSDRHLCSIFIGQQAR